MSKDYEDKDHLTKGPGGFETDNPYVEGAIATAIVAGVVFAGTAVYKVGKGIGKFFSNSKAELDEINVNVNGSGVGGSNNKRKRS